jgi:hypothetical protein
LTDEKWKTKRDWPVATIVIFKAVGGDADIRMGL